MIIIRNRNGRSPQIELDEVFIQFENGTLIELEDDDGKGLVIKKLNEGPLDITLPGDK